MISETAHQLANGSLTPNDYLANLDPDRREQGDLRLLTRLAIPVTHRQHGTCRYKVGCRCLACRVGNAEANRQYRQRRKAAA